MTPKEITEKFNDMWRKLYDVSVEEKMPQMLKTYVNESLIYLLDYVKSEIPSVQEVKPELDRDGDVMAGRNLGSTCRSCEQKWRAEEQGAYKANTDCIAVIDRIKKEIEV